MTRWKLLQRKHGWITWKEWLHLYYLCTLVVPKARRGQLPQMQELPKSTAPEGDELQVTGYFVGITDVVFCIISAKFASCRQDEVRGSTHSMIGGNFLDLDRKDLLLWWSNSLFFPLPIFSLPSTGFGIELHISFFPSSCYHRLGRNWLLPSVQPTVLIRDFASNPDAEESSFAHGSAPSTH